MKLLTETENKLIDNLTVVTLYWLVLLMKWELKLKRKNEA